MKQVGLKDENFGEMTDFTGDVIVPLDFNTVLPLLQRKPVESFSIGAQSFEELYSLLKEELGAYKRENDALILMRVKEGSAEDVKDFGWKISQLFTEDSMVTWAAQSYEMFRFDVYIYSTAQEEEELERLNSQGTHEITTNCMKCGKEMKIVVPKVLKGAQDCICEDCSQ